MMVERVAELSLEEGPSPKKRRGDSAPNGMFQRKLKALQHPTPKTFDFEDEKQFQALVSWLEYEKICHYSIERRSRLKCPGSEDAPPVDIWNESLKRYLEELMCPYPIREEPIDSSKKGSKTKVIFDVEDRKLLSDWLLGLAVRLVYNKNKQNLRPLTSAKLSELQSMNGVKKQSNNPLDNLKCATVVGKIDRKKLARGRSLEVVQFSRFKFSFGEDLEVSGCFQIHTQGVPDPYQFYEGVYAGFCIENTSFPPDTRFEWGMVLRSYQNRLLQPMAEAYSPFKTELNYFSVQDLDDHKSVDNSPADLEGVLQRYNDFELILSFRFGNLFKSHNEE